MPTSGLKTHEGIAPAHHQYQTNNEQHNIHCSTTLPTRYRRV
jgi:hypothetical protein